MEIMNLCVLHLSDIERDTGSGVDREELIQWYLEQKETEFETEEDLEYERELIAKALTKLSRVCPFLSPLFISCCSSRLFAIPQPRSHYYPFIPFGRPLMVIGQLPT